MAETSQQIDQRPDIRIMLIGKSGHGKSSTGNSILGYDCFESRGGATSVTQACKLGSVEFEDRAMTVVDIPGICDTEQDSIPEQEKLVLDAAVEGMKDVPGGINAFLLVFSYQARLTQEERNSIASLKTLFGEDILRQYTVLVFTHGDDFWHDFAGKKPFQTWIEQQSGNLKDLFSECNNRVVLFDNRTEDENKQNTQRQELVAMIDSLTIPYTIKNIELAIQRREEKEREAKFVLMSEAYLKELNEIKSEIGKVQLYSPDARDERLLEIKVTVNNMIQKLAKESHDKLASIKTQVNATLKQITDLESVFRREREEMVRRQNAEAERLRREEELRQQRIQQERMAQKLEEERRKAKEEQENRLREIRLAEERHRQWVLEQERKRSQQEAEHQRQMEIERQRQERDREEKRRQENERQERLKREIRDREERIRRERRRNEECRIL